MTTEHNDGKKTDYNLTVPAMQRGDTYVRSEPDYLNARVLHHAVNAEHKAVLYYCTKDGVLLQRMLYDANFVADMSMVKRGLNLTLQGLGSETLRLPVSDINIDEIIAHVDKDSPSYKAASSALSMPKEYDPARVEREMTRRKYRTSMMLKPGAPMPQSLEELNRDTLASTDEEKVVAMEAWGLSMGGTDKVLERSLSKTLFGDPKDLYPELHALYTATPESFLGIIETAKKENTGTTVKVSAEGLVMLEKTGDFKTGVPMDPQPGSKLAKIVEQRGGEVFSVGRAPNAFTVNEADWEVAKRLATDVIRPNKEGVDINYGRLAVGHLQGIPFLGRVEGLIGMGVPCIYVSRIPQFVEDAKLKVTWQEAGVEHAVTIYALEREDVAELGFILSENNRLVTYWVGTDEEIKNSRF